MSYINTSTRTTKSTSTENFQAAGRSSSLFGVFLGFIKEATDVQRNGRLRVWIPEFGSAPENEDGWTIVNYCSPFAGATNVNSISATDTQSFDQTQTSYGMWMVPPDVGNEVLVMFINGDSSRGVWIGCLYNQFMNNMVPGMAADSKNWQYPGKVVPVAEYNKWGNVVEPDRAIKPYQKTKFKGLGNQGLITDPGRGITSSGARREAPSAVFGIITPGPVIDTNVTSDKYRRKGGSSFIMDDGIGTEYVQLVTKTGAQIRLDETNGFVYLINRDGTAWVQMDKTGNIDIFGAGDISCRAQRDINFRADRNVNIEAGQNIFMKAAKDTKQESTVFTYDVNNIPQTKNIPVWAYKGEGLGDGGNIIMQALNNTHTTVKNNSYLTIGTNQEITVGSTVDMSVGSEYNLTSPSIRNVGAVKVRGTLDVTGAVQFGNTLGVVSSLNAGSLSTSGSLNASTGSFLGSVNGGASEFTSVKASIDNNPGNPGTAGTAGPAVNIPTPPAVMPAEVKPLLEKMNILATWLPTVTYPSWQSNVSYAPGAIVIYNNITYIANKNVTASPTFISTQWTIFVSDDKFKRNAASLNTTVSRLPTYEPCPEHETFKFVSTNGYTPAQNEGDKTYEGSGGAGNSASVSPVTNTTPGANNTEIPPDPVTDSVVSKDFNMAAYQCQLKIHEGVKYVSYLDSLGLPTAGIGHLLRANEVSTYPVPTAVSEAQVNTWFNQDAPTSIKGVQELLGMDVWANLSDIRKRASADLCYNMGKGRLSKFRRFIAGMKANDWNLAGASLRDSVWFTQVGRRGPNIITMIVNNVDPNGCDKKFPI